MLVMAQFVYYIYTPHEILNYKQFETAAETHYNSHTYGTASKVRIRIGNVASEGVLVDVRYVTTKMADMSTQPWFFHAVYSAGCTKNKHHDAVCMS